MTLIKQVQQALDLVSDVYGTEPRTAILAGREIIITAAFSGEVVGLIRLSDDADKVNARKVANNVIDALTGAV